MTTETLFDRLARDVIRAIEATRLFQPAPAKEPRLRWPEVEFNTADDYIAAEGFTLQLDTADDSKIRIYLTVDVTVPGKPLSLGDPGDPDSVDIKELADFAAHATSDAAAAFVAEIARGRAYQALEAEAEKALWEELREAELVDRGQEREK